MTATTFDEIEPSLLPPRPGDSGCGIIRLARVGTRTIVENASATSPLKLLTPRMRGQSAWVFTSTYGGGLVGGDEICLDLHAKPNTRALLSTQSSTKIYRSAGDPCRQSADVRIDAGAVVVHAPDPLVCFAQAKLLQRQTFSLDPSASLVFVDALTSGRRARGERWAFDSYENQTTLSVGDRRVFRDVLRLDRRDGDLTRATRMGACDCFATLLLAGPHLLEQSRAMLEMIEKSPMQSGHVLFSASPIESGIVVRVAGADIESMMRWIHARLDFVRDFVDEDPWSRKW
jgi:urease accessory protein